MSNTINFHEIWAEKHLPEAHRGFKVISELSDEDAKAVLDFVMFNILYEIRVELGLIELDEDQEKQ